MKSVLISKYVFITLVLVEFRAALSANATQDRHPPFSFSTNPSLNIYPFLAWPANASFDNHPTWFWIIPAGFDLNSPKSDSNLTAVEKTVMGKYKKTGSKALAPKDATTGPTYIKFSTKRMFLQHISPISWEAYSEVPKFHDAEPNRSVFWRGQFNLKSSKELSEPNSKNKSMLTHKKLTLIPFWPCPIEENTDYKAGWETRFAFTNTMQECLDICFDSNACNRISYDITSSMRRFRARARDRRTYNCKLHGKSYSPAEEKKKIYSVKIYCDSKQHDMKFPAREPLGCGLLIFFCVAGSIFVLFLFCNLLLLKVCNEEYTKIHFGCAIGTVLLIMLIVSSVIYLIVYVVKQKGDCK